MSELRHAVVCDACGRRAMVLKSWRLGRQQACRAACLVVLLDRYWVRDGR